jgi:hypothetical protein
VKEPLACVATGGASPKPRRRALKVLASSSEATVATLKQSTIETRNASFFMLEFLLLTGTLRELAFAGNDKHLLEKSSR